MRGFQPTGKRVTRSLLQERLGNSGVFSKRWASTALQKSEDVVIGAGIIGVCTAYNLAKQGRKVTVLERASAPAQGTSYINGTLICPSLMLPWTGARQVPKVFKSFFDARHPLKVHASAMIDPTLWRFGVHYMAACRPGQLQTNTRRLARLAAYSRACLGNILDEHPDLGPAMEQTATGTLQVFDSADAMKSCLQSSIEISSAGVPLTVLSPEKCDAVDPFLVKSLKAQGKEAVYIYSDLDTNGCCHTLTNRLAAACKEMGVKFEYNTQVDSFDKDADGNWNVLLADGQSASGENIVLCAGFESPNLAAKLGLYLPMYPVKGYAITVPLNPGVAQLRGNVVQDSKKLYLAPLGPNHIRITGCAEFAGNKAEVDMERASILTRQAEEILPGMMDFSKATYYAGLRPLSADDVPILGSAGNNVYLNTGHGSKGWTHAFGCGQMLADVIGGSRPALDLEDYDLARFWPARAEVGRWLRRSPGQWANLSRVSLPLPAQ